MEKNTIWKMTRTVDEILKCQKPANDVRSLVSIGYYPTLIKFQITAHDAPGVRVLESHLPRFLL